MHPNIDKPPFHFTILHLEVVGDFCGHFFNPYIKLHLDDKFDFFPNVSTSTYVVDPCNEVFIFVTSLVPHLVLNPSFHFNPDDVAFAYFPLIQVNVPLGNEVVGRIDYEFHDREPIPKSRFLEIDDKELENVNKGGQRMSKHIELWAMNGDYFMVLTWQNLLLICLKMKVGSRTLWLCYHLLFCKLQKKIVAYILQPCTIFYHFLNVFIIGGFFFHHVFFLLLSCLCFYKLCVSYVIRFRVYVKVLGLKFMLML